MYLFEIKREVDTNEKDELNRSIYAWHTVHTCWGYLDLLTGSDEQQHQNSLLATSSHVFLTKDTSFLIKSNDMIYNPRTDITYEITFVDNVMELDDHYEIYCKRWV
ncbi:hypothetical protein IGJ28_000756 [Enterococcus sp. AZ091]|uniref:phage head-tail adapter protein n=1 Tax=Enterococcus sp. AZ091 TaxID=2774720 RepID=UPI003F255B5A